MCWNAQKHEKIIPNIIDHNLKKRYQFLIILAKIFLTLLATLPGEKRPSKSCWNEWKTSINSIHQDLWAPTVGRLQDLTVIKQWWGSGMLINQEVTGEVCIGLKQNIINTAVNECWKHLHACVRTMCPQFKQFCCRQLKNETLGWNVSQSIKKVNNICFCALFRLSNNTALPYFLH